MYPSFELPLLIIALFANDSSCTISSRTNVTTFTEPSCFFKVNLTSVPFLPRISFTASSTTKPVSSVGSSLPCPTFKIISPTCTSPLFQAGLPATSVFILILPSSYIRDAPIPKKRPLICSSKYLLSTGGKNSVCGSIAFVIMLTNKLNLSSSENLKRYLSKVLSIDFATFSLASTSNSAFVFTLKPATSLFLSLVSIRSTYLSRAWYLSDFLQLSFLCTSVEGNFILSGSPAYVSSIE